MGKRVPPVADPDPNGPHSDNAVQLAVRCRDARCETVRIVHQIYRRCNPMLTQLRGQQFGDACAFQLGQVRRLLYHSVADQARQSNSHGGKIFLSVRCRHHLVAQGLDDRLSRHLDQRVLIVVCLGKRAQPTRELMIHYQPGYHALG